MCASLETAFIFLWFFFNINGTLPSKFQFDSLNYFAPEEVKSPYDISELSSQDQKRYFLVKRLYEKNVNRSPIKKLKTKLY